MEVRVPVDSDEGVGIDVYVMAGECLLVRSLEFVVQ